jgi:anti-sigma regulatory factor (Ser/Thr protein kinase)
VADASRSAAAARTSTQLPHAPSSARAARRFIAAALHGWGLDALIEVVALLAGELVTNAIAHTPATTVGIGLVVCSDDDVVRVEVHDASPQSPKLSGLAGGDAEAGRGLGLVAALATRWGVDASVNGDGRGHGKAVWFQVHIGSPS